MKSLIKKITSSKIGTILKNNLNYRAVPFNLEKIKHSSVSDAFLWRTDNGFSTIFKFTDIFKLFFKIEGSQAEIIFYNKNNEKIKKVDINQMNYSNELLINTEFLNNIEDYGTFYIYHFTNQKIENENILSNRCYLGFSKGNNIYSFVHGNTFSRFKKLDNQITEGTDITNTTFLKNQSYKIQKYFGGFDKHELFFANPTSKNLDFSINEKKFALKSGSLIMIEIKEKEKIEIISNCLFFRPTIFSYKRNYFDVHHS
tara:strand:- start:2285 stop:3055 length:771 start_codon:yes stop_codon:yes gene_type:complete